MNKRVVLISHAATAAMRQGRFPDDDALDPRGIAQVEAWRDHIPRLAERVVLGSPAVCVRDTAQALGLEMQVDPELADMDYGRWRGRRLSELAGEMPLELAAWTRDPDAAPHGGESFAAVVARVGRWLDALPLRTDGDVMAITHAAVIRAALIRVMDAPASSFARIEIGPLSVVELRWSERGWKWWASSDIR